MGRGLLITVTLIVGVYSLIVISMQERKTQIVRQNVDRAREIQARNAAYSGVDLAIHDLKENNWDYNSFGSQRRYKLGESSVSIQLNTPLNSAVAYNQLRVISTGISGQVKKDVSALMNTNMPTPQAAMAFYGNNDVNFNANGNAFQINGNDTDPDGGSGTAPSIPGVAAQDSNAYQGFQNGLQGNQGNNIKGKGGTPSMAVEPTMDPKSLQQEVNNWTQNADNTIGNSNSNNNNKKKKGPPSKGKKMNSVQWGDENDPEITVVNEDIEIAGNSEGYGILVVRNNASITVKGNFNFKGLLLTNGQDMALDARGNTKLYGSVISLPDQNCGTTENGCNTSVSLSGNIDMFYSSETLTKTQSGLSNQLNIEYTKANIYD